jgi:hypothetical protein
MCSDGIERATKTTKTKATKKNIRRRLVKTGFKDCAQMPHSQCSLEGKSKVFAKY